MGAPKVNVPAPLPAPATAIQPKTVEAPELSLDTEDTPSELMVLKKKGKKALRVDTAGLQTLPTTSGLQIPNT